MKFIRHTGRVMALLTVLVVAPAALFAQAIPPDPASVAPHQQDPAPATRPADSSGLSLQLATGVGHQFDAGIDEGGEFSVTRVGFSIAMAYPIGRRLTMTHPLVYDYDDYHFSGADFGRPWRDTHTLTYTPNLDWRLDEHWSLNLGAAIGFSAESGAELDHALIGGGSLAARYRFSDRLTLGLGVIAVTQIEDDVRVLPSALFNWRITDQLALRNVRPMAGIRGGAGAELAWDFTETLSIALAVNYDSRRFRLDENDGVGEHRRIPVYAELGFRPNRHVSLALLAGMAFGGELTLEDKRGERIAQENYDPAPFIGVGGALRF